MHDSLNLFAIVLVLSSPPRAAASAPQDPLYAFREKVTQAPQHLSARPERSQRISPLMDALKAAAKGQALKVVKRRVKKL